MNIIPDETFHIYNQGNNQETVFYEDADYRAFLKLFRKFVYPHAKVLAWCLMPNHFHFLIHATEDSAKLKQIGNIEVGELSNGFRLLESQYAHYINKKHARSGSLFRQKTKAKPMSEGDIHYEFTAFIIFIRILLLPGWLQKWKIGNILLMRITWDYVKGHFVTRNFRSD